MKLTQKTVAGLVLADGKAEAIFFDDDIAGFGLRLRAGGSRTWIFQYRQGNKQHRMTLGSARAERARQIAEELHAKVRLGQDPAGEKFESRAKAAETMEAVLPAARARAPEAAYAPGDPPPFVCLLQAAARPANRENRPAGHRSSTQ